MKKNKIESQRNDFWSSIGIIIVFIGIIVVYSTSYDFEFTYDDTVMIVRQDIPSSIGSILNYFKEQYYPELPYYRPITKITFILQKAIHGNNPVPFRFFNAFIIGLASIFVYAMLRLAKINFPKLAALFATALFGLHPIVSACVFPVWGRDSLLFGFFIIVALYAFLRPGKIWYSLAVIFCALALLSKETSVILIGLFVLADILKLSADSPGTNIRKWIRRYWIIVFIYILYFTVRHSLFGGRQYNFTLLDNPTLPLSTPIYALQVMIAPFVELIYEPRTWRIWFSLQRMIITGIAIFLIAFLSAKHWSSMQKPILFWIGWFFLCNLPTSNIIEQETIYAERFLFPSILAIIVIIFMVLINYWNIQRVRWIIISINCILLISCTSITIDRSKYYKNNLVFYRQWLKVNPNYFLPNHAMGTVLFESGKVEEAAEYYRKAIVMKPDWPDAHLNLGIIYMDQQKYDKATKCMLEYVKLKPNSAKAHYSLGVALTKQNKFNDALVYYLHALEIDPSYVEAHHNMGVIYHIQGQLDKAVTHYQAALRINPNKENTLQYLRIIENSEGQLDLK